MFLFKITAYGECSENNMHMNKKSSSLLVIGLLGLVYVIGPRKQYDPVVTGDVILPPTVQETEEWLINRESQIPGLKPGNEARIVWANDSLKNKTDYALVYLHGFSASHEEGAPLHTEVARRYGMNLYLSRLEDHGRLDSNTFIHLTPDQLVYSAEEAFRIGKMLGDSVILMSCSTGGTLSLILADQGFDIHSMIMYSPNIDIYDKKSDLLLYPYGESLSDWVMGGKYNRIDYDSTAQLFWNPIYHTNGLFTLKRLIKDFMKRDVFEGIHIPVFLGYYFKDEKNQDKIVSVDRMHDFFNQLGTPENKKRKIAFPEAGNHVISSYVLSRDMESVRYETFRFIDDILMLPRADTTLLFQR